VESFAQRALWQRQCDPPTLFSKEEGRIFQALWHAGLAEHESMQGIAWPWQSIDGAMMQALLAQEAVGPNRTGSGENGSKRHLLVDGCGVPLSRLVTAANVNDAKRLGAVLAAIQIKLENRPH
jgi:hypothetical protein